MLCLRARCEYVWTIMKMFFLPCLGVISALFSRVKENLG